jgi:hypothetical protein
MATLEILVNGIHAEIKDGDRVMIANSSIKINPLSCSYSTLGVLNKYTLEVQNVSGLTEYSILENGKNSRFSCVGTGTCDILLTIIDDKLNEDTDTITITIV